MKVLCIDGIKQGRDRGVNNSGKATKLADVYDEIYEGETYTVVAERNVVGVICYVLAEKSPFNSYNKRRFIPLSTISETTFEREYNKQQV